MNNEMLSTVVVLCILVTTMLFFFLAFHYKLISSDKTTNEYSKHGSIKRFLSEKFWFLKRWEESRLTKKAFKPSATAIEKYVVRNDIKVDISDADLTKVREVTQV